MSLYRLFRIDSGLSSDFECGDDDLDQFFRHDRRGYEANLQLATYALTGKSGDILAMISLANDYIDSEFEPGGPAVKITALGVHKNFHNIGLGSNLIAFIQAFFVIRNKTGCRYLTVHAYNDPRCLKFYQEHCGFHELAPPGARTTPHYFDLLEAKRALEGNRPVFERYEAAIVEMLNRGIADLPILTPLRGAAVDPKASA